MRLIAVALLCAAWFGLGGAARAADDMPPIPKEWLDKRVSIEEAEAANPGISDDRVQRFPDAAKPFGFEHHAWEEFKVVMQPDDQLWTFASPLDSWKNLAGRAGIALVRNGTPVKVIITLKN